MSLVGFWMPVCIEDPTCACPALFLLIHKTLSAPDTCIRILWDSPFCRPLDIIIEEVNSSDEASALKLRIKFMSFILLVVTLRWCRFLSILFRLVVLIIISKAEMLCYLSSQPSLNFIRFS